VLGGCNWVYGLGDTRPIDAAIPIDAQYFDAPVDAPWTCPAMGTEPIFADRYKQLATTQKDCIGYMFAADTGFGVATCNHVVMEAADGETLAPARLDPAIAYANEPRISPDGQLLFVRNGNTSMVDIYKRQPDGSWLANGKKIGDASYRNLSNPTRGPQRRAVQWDYNGSSYYVNELVEQPDESWSVVTTYTVTGVLPVSEQPLSLSSDGLRLTFLGYVGSASGGVKFMQRFSVSEPFTTLTAVTTVPNKDLAGPFMTDDCGQLYYSALRTVFSQHQ
jgi:hypothetical protein